MNLNTLIRRLFLQVVLGGIATVLVGFIVLQHNNSYKIYKQNTSHVGVIVVAEGGLGNQLFRYACSYALARKRNIPLYVYIPYGYNRGWKRNEKEEELKSPNTRIFALDEFHIPLTNLINETTYYAWQNENINTKFNDIALFYNKSKLYQDKYLEHYDYCQSELFFKEYKNEIKQMYVLKNINKTRIQNWVDLISLQDQPRGNTSAVSIAVHIRRGDYVWENRTNMVTPLTFYQDAMRIMISKIKEPKVFNFFVFTDDIQFAYPNLLKDFTTKELESFNVYFVSHDENQNVPFIHYQKDNPFIQSNPNLNILRGVIQLTNLEEFYLMMLCSHIIVSNSTFSWWAAYLMKNLNKIVIGPKFHKKFFEKYKDRIKREFKKLLINERWYPKDWIAIYPYNE